MRTTKKTFGLSFLWNVSNVSHVSVTAVPQFSFSIFCAWSPKTPSDASAFKTRVKKVFIPRRQSHNSIHQSRLPWKCEKHGRQECCFPVWGKVVICRYSVVYSPNVYSVWKQLRQKHFKFLSLRISGLFSLTTLWTLAIKKTTFTMKCVHSKGAWPPAKQRHAKQQQHVCVLHLFPNSLFIIHRLLLQYCRGCCYNSTTIYNSCSFIKSKF